MKDASAPLRFIKSLRRKGFCEPQTWSRSLGILEGIAECGADSRAARNRQYWGPGVTATKPWALPPCREKSRADVGSLALLPAATKSLPWERAPWVEPRESHPEASVGHGKDSSCCLKWTPLLSESRMYLEVNAGLQSFSSLLTADYSGSHGGKVVRKHRKGYGLASMQTLLICCVIECKALQILVPQYINMWHGSMCSLTSGSFYIGRWVHTSEKSTVETIIAQKTLRCLSVRGLGPSLHVFLRAVNTTRWWHPILHMC